ncbi:uncharacterized protein LOC124120481 [Haliotis rufescens]|uniref:uncharacterized protein LOC124120481 n=1 Tax=Haliotis rufescens TaxID=6454 RepID=UPI00201EE7EA|nr:uncharacterized protein LOC124120481 [Haliotis rufescens]
MEEPDCDFDETTKAGFVRVRMRIQGIKPGRGSQAEKGNAELVGPLYGNDNLSITLKILDKGGLDDSNYQYHVSQLPGAIVPEKTKLKIEKGWVFMFLKKKNKDKSWESNFRNGTLETE